MIPELRKLRKDDGESEVSLEDIEKFCLKTNKQMPPPKNQ